MAAGKHNLEIEKGATFSRVITWKDEGGSAVDLTNYTARMHIRRSVNDADILVDLTTENGRISLGGAEGTVTLTIASADTSLVTGNRGVYDLELVSASGVVTRLIEGNVIFSSEVTR